MIISLTIDLIVFEGKNLFLVGGSVTKSIFF